MSQGGTTPNSPVSSGPGRDRSYPYTPTEGDVTPTASNTVTPRASQDQIIDKKETSCARNVNGVLANNLPDADADAASTLATSTLNSYAPSSIMEHKSLLPSGRYGLPVEERLQKTTGRKVFEGFCGAVNIMVPIDINSEVTSMDESSLGRLAKAVQRKEKSSAQYPDIRTPGRTGV